MNATLKVSSGNKYCNTNNLVGNGTWLDCFCKDGYVYDSWKSQCLLPGDCLMCGENQVIDYSGCVQTCDNFSLDCTDITYQAKCYCKNGYVLVSNASSECIPVTSCPNIRMLFTICNSLKSGPRKYFYIFLFQVLTVATTKFISSRGTLIAWQLTQITRIMVQDVTAKMDTCLKISTVMSACQFHHVQVIFIRDNKIK